MTQVISNSPIYPSLCRFGNNCYYGKRCKFIHLSDYKRKDETTLISYVKLNNDILRKIANYFEILMNGLGIKCQNISSNEQKTDEINLYENKLDVKFADSLTGNICSLSKETDRLYNPNVLNNGPDAEINDGISNIPVIHPLQSFPVETQQQYYQYKSLVTKYSYEEQHYMDSQNGPVDSIAPIINPPVCLPKWNSNAGEQYMKTNKDEKNILYPKSNNVSNCNYEINNGASVKHANKISKGMTKPEIRKQMITEKTFKNKKFATKDDNVTSDAKENILYYELPNGKFIDFHVINENIKIFVQQKLFVHDTVD